MNCTQKQFPNIYSVYKLNKRQLGDYLNIWFCKSILRSDLPQNKVKVKRGILDDDFVISDNACTVKSVDEKTALCLYNKRYNPISIKIMCPSGAIFQYSDGEKLYNMKCQIHSIDDSQFGIYFNNFKIEDLRNKRIQLMEFIDNRKKINGEELLTYCIELGADEKTIDYN